MTTGVLQYALEGSTAVLTMDDGKANALSDVMITSLLEALTRAQKEASAVVLLGRTDRFCAGFDLKVMTAGAEGVRKLFLHGAELLVRLCGLPMPLIIGCSGHAMAGGAQVLLTGDTLYPGRLYIRDFTAYQTSIDRLVAFGASHPVCHVLGTHIEMTSTAKKDYEFEAPAHPAEHMLQLTLATLTELRDGLAAMGGVPAREPHDDFVIYPL